MLWISVVNVKQTIKNHFWQLKIKKKKNLDEDVSLKNLCCLWINKKSWSWSTNITKIEMKNKANKNIKTN